MMRILKKVRRMHSFFCPFEKYQKIGEFTFFFSFYPFRSIIRDFNEGFIEDKFQGNDEISERLAEIIVRKKKFIPSVIALIESYDFNVRRFVSFIMLFANFVDFFIRFKFNFLRKILRRNYKNFLKKPIDFFRKKLLLVSKNYFKKNLINFFAKFFGI